MSSSYNSRPSGKQKGTHGKSKAPIIIVLAVALVVVAGLGIFVYNRMNAGDGDKAPAINILGSNKIHDGVFIDGISVGGLTPEDAKQQVVSQQQQNLKKLGVNVIGVDNTKTFLAVSTLPESAYSTDTDAILDQAVNLDKATEDQLATTPLMLTTTVKVKDPSSFKQKVVDLTTPYYQPPTDAEFDPTQYDPTKEGADRLNIKPEVLGKQVNADKLWEAVQAEFTNGTFHDVQMTVEDVQPETTTASLQENLQLVKISPITAGDAAENTKLNAANEGHTYTTQIKVHSTERLTNIQLANKAVSGVVQPGEEFSMNDRTGDRTKAQGYQIAPVDKNGIVDQGLGGGVCQVSGTLYNAAVRYGGKYEEGAPNSTKTQPGLAVTARDSHSLPSGYLHTGTDATVDISSGKDLKLRNDFDQPVYIFMYYDKNSKGEYFEHCDIYGPPLPDGATYDLLRKNTKTIPANTAAAPKVVYSKYATPGSPKLISASNGYSVDIYIEKNVNGQKTSTKAYSSSYQPQPPSWYVYTGDTIPTPTPSDIPTIGASPTPTPSGSTPADTTGGTPTTGASTSPSASPSPAGT